MLNGDELRSTKSQSISRTYFSQNFAEAVFGKMNLWDEVSDASDILVKRLGQLYHLLSIAWILTNLGLKKSNINIQNDGFQCHLISLGVYQHLSHVHDNLYGIFVPLYLGSCEQAELVVLIGLLS